MLLDKTNNLIPSKAEKNCIKLERKLEPLLQKAMEQLNLASSTNGMYQDLISKITTMLNEYNNKKDNIKYLKSTQNTQFNSNVILQETLEREAVNILENINDEVKVILDHFNITIEPISPEITLARKVEDVKNIIDLLQRQKQTLEQEQSAPHLIQKVDKQLRKQNLHLSKLQKKQQNLTFYGRFMNTLNPTSYLQSARDNYQYYFTNEIEMTELTKIDKKINAINNKIAIIEQKMQEIRSNSPIPTAETYQLMNKLQIKDEALALQLRNLIERKNVAYHQNQSSAFQKITNSIVENVGITMQQHAQNIQSSLNSTFSMFEKTSNYLLDIPLVFVDLDNAIVKITSEMKEVEEDLWVCQNDNFAEFHTDEIKSQEDQLNVLKIINNELKVFKDILHAQFENQENPICNLYALISNIEKEINEVEQSINFKNQFNLETRFDLQHIQYLNLMLNLTQRAINKIASPLPSAEINEFHHEMLESYSNNFSRILKLGDILTEKNQEDTPTDVSETDFREADISLEPDEESNIAKTVSFFQGEAIKHHGLNIEKQFDIKKNVQSTIKKTGKSIASSTSYVLFGEQGDIQLQKMLDKNQSYALNSTAKLNAERIVEAMDMKEKLVLETISVAGGHLSNKTIDYAVLSFAGSAVVTGGASLLPAVVGLGVSLIAKGAIGYLKSNVEDIVKESIKSTYVTWKYAGMSADDFEISKLNEQLDIVRTSILSLNDASFSSIEKEMRLTFLIEQVLLLEQKVLDISMNKCKLNIEKMNIDLKGLDRQLLALNKMQIPDYERQSRIQMLQNQKNQYLNNINEQNNIIQLMGSQKRMKEIEMSMTYCQRQIKLTEPNSSDQNNQLSIDYYSSMLYKLNQEAQNEFYHHQTILSQCAQYINAPIANQTSLQSTPQKHPMQSTSLNIDMTVEAESSRKRKAPVLSSYPQQYNESQAKRRRVVKEDIITEPIIEIISSYINIAFIEQEKQFFEHLANACDNLIKNDPDTPINIQEIVQQLSINHDYSQIFNNDNVQSCLHKILEEQQKAKSRKMSF